VTGTGPHVLVVAKAPVPGRVKTRLCPPCSPDEAAAIAAAALADTLEAVAASRASRRILALDGEPGEWLPPGFEVVGQGAGNLAQRLTRSWLVAGGPGVQIGSDTPQVTAAHIDDALCHLEVSPSALGLAADGGWWAIALRQPREDVFVRIPMSTADTGRHQLDRLRALGLEPAELPLLRDIDRFSDATAVAALVPGSRTARTVSRVCERLGSDSMREQLDVGLAAPPGHRAEPG
jgi:uncharacterized protein